jgi:hypothetical protein
MRASERIPLRIWGPVFFRLLALSIPIIVCIWMIVRYNGRTRGLDVFANIDGYVYPVSSILLLLVLGSIAVVAINLLFYLSDMMRQVGKNEEGVGITWRRSVLFVLVGMLLLLVAYIVLIVLATLGFKSPFSHLLELTSIFSFSRWLAVITFSCFLVIDAAFAWSYTKQLQFLFGQYSAQIGSASERLSQLFLKIAQMRNNREFALLSAVLIDLPFLILTILGGALVDYVASNPMLHAARDMDFPTHSEYTVLEEGLFELFLQGVDAGVSVSVLLMSQLVFATLVVRWVRKNRRCDEPQPTFVHDPVALSHLLYILR